jgi:hypothetical protein
MRTFSFSALAIAIMLVAALADSAFAQKATAGQKVDIGTCRQLAREKCRFAIVPRLHVASKVGLARYKR